MACVRHVAFGGPERDFRRFLEGIFLAGGVGRCGRGLADQVAEIDVVLMVGGPLGELGVGPFLDESFSSRFGSVFCDAAFAPPQQRGDSLSSRAA